MSRTNMFRRKMLPLVLTIVMVFGLTINAFATNVATPIDESHRSIPNTGSDLIIPGIEYDNSEIFIDTVEISESMIGKTGEILSISNQRAGHAISGDKGVLSGTLTNANTWDYYTFSRGANSLSLSKMITNSSNYTMTLGFVNWATGEIALSTYVTAPNTQFAVNLPAGDYAWVIQSANGVYGTSYTLQYNMTLPTSNNVIYISSDYQTIYTNTDGKLKINNVIQNIDFKYDQEWELPPVGAGELSWNKLHIWLRNPVVTAIHVGGCQWYESKVLNRHTNTIVLEVNGGWFRHSFSQNPPYYDWGTVEGDLTPGEFYGYLVYDMNTGNILEYASTITKPWSNIGDHHDFSVF